MHLPSLGLQACCSTPSDNWHRGSIIVAKKQFPGGSGHALLLSVRDEVRGMGMMRAARHILSRLLRQYREISRRGGKYPQEMLDGQLRNQAFEDLVYSLVSNVTLSAK